MIDTAEVEEDEDDFEDAQDYFDPEIIDRIATLRSLKDN